MRSEKAWEWREVKIPPIKSRQDSFTALHLFVPFIIAALLCFGGKLLFGAIVAGIGLFLLLLKFVAPHVHELIVRLLTTLGRWLGKIISYTSLTIVYIIVFTPVALFARLFHLGSLDLKWLPSSRTYWVEARKLDPTRLFDRPFLAETQQAGIDTNSEKISRVVKVLYHTALTLFFLNLAVGYFYDKIDVMMTQEKLDRMSQSSVYEDESWAEDYFKETAEAQDIIYKPFIGWSRKDYEGHYINVKDGDRKTYKASTNSSPTVLVYAFGGSTMWGSGARDDYTIPSYLAKFSEQDDIPVEVKNFAETGFVNWQDVIRLAELCAEGKIPDLVIFYEGANDVAAKLQTPYLNRVHQNLSDWQERHGNWRRHDDIPHEVREWFQKHSLVHKVGRRLGRKLQKRRAVETILSPEPERIKQLADEIVTTYGENAVFVQKLARAYGFKAWFFWQPLLLTKEEPTEEESNYQETDFGGLLSAVYRAATKEIRSQDFAIDLSDAFDDHIRTIYIDWAHVSELGNQIIANKMYEYIQPTLRTLARSKGVSRR